MAVDGFCIRLNQQPTAIGTYDVALHTSNLRSSCRRSIKKHAHLLARLKRTGNDALAIVADLGVRLTIGHRAYLRHCLLPELTTGNVPQTQLITCLYLAHDQQEANCHIE